VRATFVEGGRLQTLAADRLLMTVPFGAIRRIDFSDARLSQEKLQAMRRLRYMSIMRVFLQMSRKFWDGENVSVGTDLPINWVRDATFSQPGPRKILESWTSGWLARALSAMSEDERIRFVLDEAEQVFPGAREHFEVGAFVDWDREPYTEGGMLLPERGHAELQPVIRRPEGRMHFAGEHAGSEPYGGAMTFAIESAMRAVLEISGGVRELQPVA
jgi:monoamine oxidase